jgi:hypothetical protein
MEGGLGNRRVKMIWPVPPQTIVSNPIGEQLQRDEAVEAKCGCDHGRVLTQITLQCKVMVLGHDAAEGRGARERV